MLRITNHYCPRIIWPVVHLYSENVGLGEGSCIYICVVIHNHCLTRRIEVHYYKVNSHGSR